MESQQPYKRNFEPLCVGKCYAQTATDRVSIVRVRSIFFSLILCSSFFSLAMAPEPQFVIASG